MEIEKVDENSFQEKVLQADEPVLVDFMRTGAGTVGR